MNTLDSHKNISKEAETQLHHSEISESSGTKTLAHNPEIDDISHLARIRDILFGAQSRDYDQKLVEIEEKTLREYIHLKEDFQGKIDTLKSYIQKEFEASNTQLTLERIERNKTFKRCDEQCNNSNQLLGEQINKLDKKISGIASTLREEILINSKIVSDELHQKSDELIVAIEREVKILKDLTSEERRKLSTYFAQISKQLSEE
jgi:hypothetical protein